MRLGARALDSQEADARKNHLFLQHRSRQTLKPVGRTCFDPNLAASLFSRRGCSGTSPADFRPLARQRRGRVLRPARASDNPGWPTPPGGPPDASTPDKIDSREEKRTRPDNPPPSTASPDSPPATAGRRTCG